MTVSGKWSLARELNQRIAHLSMQNALAKRRNAVEKQAMAYFTNLLKTTNALSSLRQHIEASEIQRLALRFRRLHRQLPYICQFLFQEIRRMLATLQSMRTVSKKNVKIITTPCIQRVTCIRFLLTNYLLSLVRVSWGFLAYPASDHVALNLCLDPKDAPCSRSSV